MLIDLSFVFCFVFIAHLTESKLYYFHDPQAEPYFFEVDDRVDVTPVTDPPRPKRSKSKHAIFHFGRPIFHFDSFEENGNVKNLRGEDRDEDVSYNFVDLNDRHIPLHFVALAGPGIITKCRTKSCREGRKSIELEKLKNRHKSITRSGPETTRFKIIDNGKKLGSKYSKRRKPLKKEYSSEENHGKRKPKTITKKKKKNVYHSSSEEDTSDSYESREKPKSKKKKTKKSVYLSGKKNKKHKKTFDFSSVSASVETMFESNSIEDSLKKKKKKKEDAKRETVGEMYLQGNKIYSPGSDSDVDRRRRLEQFMPKRYHWKPSQIGNLGYFWFNGPKGRYPAPKPLVYVG